MQRNRRSASSIPGGGPAERQVARLPALDVAAGAADALDHRLARVRALQRPLQRPASSSPAGRRGRSLPWRAVRAGWRGHEARLPPASRRVELEGPLLSGASWSRHPRSRRGLKECATTRDWGGLSEVHRWLRLPQVTRVADLQQARPGRRPPASDGTGSRRRSGWPCSLGVRNILRQRTSTTRRSCRRTAWHRCRRDGRSSRPPARRTAPTTTCRTRRWGGRARASGATSRSKGARQPRGLDGPEPAHRQPRAHDPPGVPAVEGLNALVAAWLQFMIHDWFGHGHAATGECGRCRWSTTTLGPSIRCPSRRRPPTRPVPTPPTGSRRRSSTPRRTGGTARRCTGRARSTSSRDGRAPTASCGSARTACCRGRVTARRTRPRCPGWWLGLSMLSRLFVAEHNAVCDRLKREYPAWSDEDLFQRARLVNAAVLAKIHTVEWTPAVI